MKYIKPLAWEAWWIVHATVAMVIFPLIWANRVVPDLGQVIAQAPANEVLAGSLLGFVWGIGGIMFGISVGYIGVSLTYGIVMGLCSIAGVLIPFFLRFDSINPASIPFILIGLVLLAIAVYIVTVAGLKRDKQLAEGGEELYDHRNDPYEWNNLAGNPEYAQIKRTLESQMDALLLKPSAPAQPAPEKKSSKSANEAWKDKYFGWHSDADTDGDGELSWAEYKVHKKALDAKQKK